MNAINRATRQGLLEAVDWAERQGLERVILSGAGSCFAAGADAKEFNIAPEAPHLPDVLNRIESSTVPWISASAWCSSWRWCGIGVGMPLSRGPQ